MAELPKVAEEAVRKIDSKLECSICLDNLKEPKLLPCFHVFCKSPCLERLVVQSPEGQSLNCPTCRQHITLPESGVAGLQTDFHIEHLFEIKKALEKTKQSSQCEICNGESAPASLFCQQCEKQMCENCAKVHEMWGEFKSHTIVECVSDERRSSASAPPKLTTACQKHSKVEAKIFCQTCSELICSDCAVSIHKAHDYSLVDDILPKYKEELASTLEPLKEQQSKVQEALVLCDTRVQDIENRKAILESSISLKFDQLHSLLDERKTALIASLGSINDKKLKELTTHKEYVEMVLAKLSACIEYAESSLQIAASEVVRGKAPTLEQIKQIIANFNLDSIQPQTEADIELLYADAANKACQEVGEVVCDPVSAENSYASGNGITFAVAEKLTTNVRVHLMTARGKRCEESAQLSAELVHSRSSATIQCEVKQEGGVCKISYKPITRGKHHLDIIIRNEHIRGSPYQIAITPSVESLTRPRRVIRGLNKPYGLTMNSRGHIVTIERFEHKQCVTTVTVGGERPFGFGTRGGKNGQFNCPRMVAVDFEDNIYVADKDNHRIQKFTAEGKFLSVVGNRGSTNFQFAFPNGICFSKVNQNIYVCDQQNHRMQVLSVDLNFIRCFGSEGGEEGQFKSPMCACFDDANNLYVTDSGNNRVQVFTAEGEFLRAFSDKADGKKLEQPFAIAIDSSNIVYVSEWEKNCISLFTAMGNHMISFGENGNKEGEFNKVRGLCIDQHDSVFVSDQQNNRIQIF